MKWKDKKKGKKIENFLAKFFFFQESNAINDWKRKACILMFYLKTIKLE